MPEMWQCAADSYREVGGESGAAVLGLLNLPQVQNHAGPLTTIH